MKNYSLTILGPSGSGKSIFLASFYKVLSISGDFGFFIDVQDPMKRQSLNKIYADLTVGEIWPSGTRNISEWVFTCYVNTPELSKVPACKLTYIDYAGGTITDLSTEEKSYSDYADLESYLKTSDAVLAVLDGQKLLSCMEDRSLTNKSVLRWIHEDFPNLMQMVAKCKKDTPAHFIISKWDLLENSYSLTDIRNFLLDTVSEFHNVVESRRRVGCPVHLVPVSSLGNNFTTLQSDGQMKKIPGKVPRPINVEIPFAFALTSKPTDKPTNLKRLGFKFVVQDWVVLGFCVVLLLAHGAGFIIALLYFGVRMFLFKRNINKQTADKNISENDAFNLIFSKCMELKNQFKSDFPDSDITATSFSSSSSSGKTKQ